MNWGSVGSFLAMGGYAPFVWGAYGMMLVVLVVEVTMLRRRASAAQAELRRNTARPNPSHPSASP